MARFTFIKNFVNKMYLKENKLKKKATKEEISEYFKTMREQTSKVYESWKKQYKELDWKQRTFLRRNLLKAIN